MAGRPVLTITAFVDDQEQIHLQVARHGIRKVDLYAAAGAIQANVWGLAVAAANAPLTPPKGPEAN